MIAEVFLDTTVVGEDPVGDSGESKDEEEEVIIDKSVEVAAYNATGVKGIAGRMKDTLQGAGYNVKKVANYDETGLSESIIYAKDKTKATQFLQYVEGADIIEDKSIAYDIEIVIGSESVED